MKTASAPLKGFEVMRVVRRGHCRLRRAGVTGEIRLVYQLFGLPHQKTAPVVLISAYCSECNIAAECPARTAVRMAHA
jgi:hypothetical protein